MSVLLYGILALWLACNVIVFIMNSPVEMYVKLVQEQNLVGRICGNAFYLPCWIVKFIVCFISHWLRKLGKLLRYIFFAVARFFQVIYHSIVDIL